MLHTLSHCVAQAIIIVQEPTTLKSPWPAMEKFLLQATHPTWVGGGSVGGDAAGGLRPSWKPRDPRWRSPHLSTPASGDRGRPITRWLLKLSLDAHRFHVCLHAIGQSKSCGHTQLWEGLGGMRGPHRELNYGRTSIWMNEVLLNKGPHPSKLNIICFKIRCYSKA